LFVTDYFVELRLADVEVDEYEVQKLTALADEDGQVNRNNFEHYCKTSEMFRGLDKYVGQCRVMMTADPLRNHDGVISDVEVTSKAELAFKALDKNNDGFISKREFENISKHLTKEQVCARQFNDLLMNFVTFFLIGTNYVEGLTR
jgi:hypothetical protein